MASLKGLLVLLLTLAVAYYLYTPVPADLDQRGSVIAFCVFRKIVLPLMSRIGPVFLGYKQYYDVARASSNIFMRKNDLDMDPDLQVMNTELDAVPVRVYRPRGATVPSPVLMHFHGGGWSIGSIDIEDNVSRFYAKKSNMVVVSVEYRLAPEHPFPASLEDCVRATVHVLSKGEQLGLDTKRVALIGLSAGGNLAAAVALRLQDPDLQSLSRLSGQVLIFPCLQAVDFSLPSYIRNQDSPVLSPHDMARYYLSYAGLDLDDHIVQQTINGQHIRHTTRLSLTKYIHHSLVAEKENETTVADASTSSGPDASTSSGPDASTSSGPVNESLAVLAEPVVTNYLMAPILAPEHILGRVPPALVLMAHYDVLHDDAVLYVKRLNQAGVDVTSHLLKTGHHLSMYLGLSDGSLKLRSAEVEEAYDKIITFLKDCTASVK